MPRGAYELLGEGQIVGVESFTSAPGPMGWRYVSSVQPLDDSPGARIDLSVDAHGRTVRTRVARGEHELLVVVRGRELVGLLDTEPIVFEYPAGTPFSFPSPGFYAVALHRLDVSTDEVVLAIDPETLAPRPVPRRAELIGPGIAASPAGAFEVHHWLVDGVEVMIADTVVVTVSDLARLRSYDRGATGPQPRLRQM
jgi:hypothetical protein